MYKHLELHNHTTESDASITCLELVDFMEENRVDAFALTDHNTISGHPKIKALLAEKNSRLQCIYGMEYTTYYGHILCLNLHIYVPWDSIDKNHPERLFDAIHQQGAIAGIAHPFSYGYPFATGCRFEMAMTDYSKADFVEIFNNPEPLHQVNEKGFLFWQSLIFSGWRPAASCGMDLHGKWPLEGHYATYIKGQPGGDIAQELSQAFQEKQTWVSKGILLLCQIDPKERISYFSLLDLQKKGFQRNREDSFLLVLNTSQGSLTKAISFDNALSVPLDDLLRLGQKVSSPCFSDCTPVIPLLYGKDTSIEELICVSPVLYLE